MDKSEKRKQWLKTPAGIAYKQGRLRKTTSLKASGYYVQTVILAREQMSSVRIN
jgi:hypothetical protein